jgi:predicted nucleotidyltransferase
MPLPVSCQAFASNGAGSTTKFSISPKRARRDKRVDVWPLPSSPTPAAVRRGVHNLYLLRLVSTLAATRASDSGHTRLDLAATRRYVLGVEPLVRVAAALSIPVRTLRRAASEGLVRGERVSPRLLQIPLSEEEYLRSHWPLLRALRGSLRTEPNVRLAVLFGSVATGDDDDRSDIDVLVVIAVSHVGRVAELSDRLSRAVGRHVRLVRLSDAEGSPALMRDILDQGRVLVDRDCLWPGLHGSIRRWRRLARRLERSAPPRARSA